MTLFSQELLKLYRSSLQQASVDNGYRRWSFLMGARISHRTRKCVRMNSLVWYTTIRYCCYLQHPCSIIAFANVTWVPNFPPPLNKNICFFQSISLQKVRYLWYVVGTNTFHKTKTAHLKLLKSFFYLFYMAIVVCIIIIANP